jgi:hypothetical protein
MPRKKAADPAASAWGQVGANISWGRCLNRTIRTAPARAAFEQRFLTEAGGDPVRAQYLRRAYFKRMAIKSAESRRKKAGAA